MTVIPKLAATVTWHSTQNQDIPMAVASTINTTSSEAGK
jgi:hypothetical protein